MNPGWSPGVRLVVVRHGATALTGEVLNGGGAAAADPLVSDRGIAALERLRERLVGLAPEQVWSSPALRALGSVDALGWPEARVERRLGEVDFGLWEGKSPGSIAAEFGELYAHWWADPALRAPAAATSLADVASGVRGWIAERCADSAGRTVGAVGHASTVRIVVAHALNLPLQEAGRISVPPAGAAIVRFWADGGSCLDSLVDPSDSAAMW